MATLQITAAHFCAAVVVGESAAPIVHYMRTWPEHRIRSYCQSRGWRVEVVEDPGLDATGKCC